MPISSSGGAPKTWSTNEFVTSLEMNQEIRDRVPGVYSSLVDRNAGASSALGAVAIVQDTNKQGGRIYFRNDVGSWVEIRNVLNSGIAEPLSIGNLIVANGITLGGVRHTTWPSGGSGSSTLIALTDTQDNYGSAGDIVTSTGTAFNLRPITNLLPNSLSLSGDLEIGGSLTLGGVERTTWPSGSGTSSFVGLNDVAVNLATSRDNFIRVNSSGNAIVADSISILDMDDTPTDLGTANQILRMNSQATALEWHLPSVSIGSFTDLDDTSDTLGSSLQIVRMNAEGTAIEFHTPSLFDYPQLPSAFGTAGQILKMNHGGNALEWSADASSGGSATFLSLTDTPNSFVTGQSLRATATGLQFYSPTFAGLSDTTSYAAQGGKYLAVNAGGSAIAYVNAPSFTNIIGTPDSFGTFAGKYLAVNEGENAVEFVDAPTGGSGGLAYGTNLPSTTGKSEDEAFLLTKAEGDDSAGLKRLLAKSSLVSSPVRVATMTVGTQSIFEGFQGYGSAYGELIPNDNAILRLIRFTASGRIILIINNDIGYSASTMDIQIGATTYTLETDGGVGSTNGIATRTYDRSGASTPFGSSVKVTFPFDIGVSESLETSNVWIDAKEGKPVVSNEFLPSPDKFAKNDITVAESGLEGADLFRVNKNELNRNRFEFISDVDSASTTNEIGWSNLESVGSYGSLARDGHENSIKNAIGALSIVPDTSATVWLYPDADDDAPASISSYNLRFVNLDTTRSYVANFSADNTSDITVNEKIWKAYKTTNATLISNIIDIMAGVGSRIQVDFFLNPTTGSTSGVLWKFRPANEWLPVDSGSHIARRLESLAGESRFDLSFGKGNNIEFRTTRPSSYDVGDLFYRTDTNALWLGVSGGTSTIPRNRLVAHMTNSKSTGFNLANSNGLFKQFDIQVTPSGSNSAVGMTIKIAPSLLREGVTAPTDLYLTTNLPDFAGYSFGTIHFTKSSLQETLNGIVVTTYFSDDITTTSPQGLQIGRFTGDTQLNLWTNSAVNTAWNFRPTLDVPTSLVEVADRSWDIVETRPSIAEAIVGKPLIVDPTDGLPNIQIPLPAGSTGIARNLFRISFADGDFDIRGHRGSSSNNYNDFLSEWTWSHSGNTLSLNVLFLMDGSTEISSFPTNLYVTHTIPTGTGWGIPTTIPLLKGETFGNAPSGLIQYTYSQQVSLVAISNVITTDYIADLRVWTDAVNRADSDAWNFRPLKDFASDYFTFAGVEGDGLIGSLDIASGNTTWTLGSNALTPPTSARWLLVNPGRENSVAPSTCSYYQVLASQWRALTSQTSGQVITLGADSSRVEVAQIRRGTTDLTLWLGRNSAGQMLFNIGSNSTYGLTVRYEL